MAVPRHEYVCSTGAFDARRGLWRARLLPGAKGYNVCMTARRRPGAAAGGEEHALGGLIDRSGSRSLGPAEDASSTGSGEGRVAEATPPHLHLPWSQARLRRACLPCDLPADVQATARTCIHRLEARWTHWASLAQPCSASSVNCDLSHLWKPEGRGMVGCTGMIKPGIKPYPAAAGASVIAALGATGALGGRGPRRQRPRGDRGPGAAHERRVDAARPLGLAAGRGACACAAAAAVVPVVVCFGFPACLHW
jgi:hypothetical protein